MTSRDGGKSNLIRSFGGFTGLQLVGFVAPFLALPVIARVAGAETWVHLAAAQAIGSLGGIVILFGWWTAGPGEYHRRKNQAERAGLYAASVQERALVSTIALPLVALIVWLLTPHELFPLCVVAALGMATYGFTPDWYFIAGNRPMRLAIFETLPRSLSTVSSIPLMVLTQNVAWFPVLQIFAVCVAYSVMWKLEISPSLRAKPALRDSLTNLRHHVPIAASNILGGVYNQLMLPLATTIAPTAALAAYVSGDKLYKASRFSIVALGNTLQSWVLSQPSRRRQWAAIGTHAVLGALGGGAIAALTPFATSILFGSELRATFPISVALGLAFFCTSVTTPLVRNLLIPNGYRRAPLLATLGATVVGLSSLYPLYHLMGGEGVAYSVALSELTSLVINGISGAKALRGINPSRS